MKTLSVRQPYAFLIVSGQKTIENRTWVTDYRGPILIHAAKKPHEHAISDIERWHRVNIDPADLHFGGIVGRVDLTEIVVQSRSHWFRGPYGWVLSNPHVVTFTPRRGFQHLYDSPAVR